MKAQDNLANLHRRNLEIHFLGGILKGLWPRAVVWEEDENQEHGEENGEEDGEGENNEADQVGEN